MIPKVENVGMNFLKRYSILLILSSFVFGAGNCLKIQGQDNTPTHTTIIHQHSETIQGFSKSYTVNLRGTLDGWNTADYRKTYGNYIDETSVFEPNEYLSIENTGNTDIVNPRIVINGRRDYFDVKSVLSGIIKRGMDDSQKAEAIFSFLADYETQGHNNNLRAGPPYPEPDSPADASTFQERANPVKALNCYYTGGCSLVSANFVILCRAAGIPARAIWLCAPDNPPKETSDGLYANHCVAEAWYNQSWHLFDVDQRVFYRKADNLTIASYDDLHQNPALLSRVVCHGFMSSSVDKAYIPYYALYPVPKEMAVGQWLSGMNMTLRPGEKFIWRWNHCGKFHRGLNPRKWSSGIPSNLANGKMIYSPRLDIPGHKAVDGYYFNIRKDTEGRYRIYPALAGEKSEIILSSESPYPIVGATISFRLKKSSSDQIFIWCSVLNKKWQPVPVKINDGAQVVSLDLDSILDPVNTPAINKINIKIELRAGKESIDSWLSDICLETDVHLNRNALPALSVGKNKVCYHAETEGEVKLIHAWKESNESVSPKPPGQAVFPKDNKKIVLDKLTMLEWAKSLDIEGKGLSGYRIQVSYEKNMTVPVSTNFDQFVNGESAEWLVPEGWLLKGHTYYWRVRARNFWGVWGKWSDVWSFMVK